MGMRNATESKRCDEAIADDADLLSVMFALTPATMKSTPTRTHTREMSARDSVENESVSERAEYRVRKG